MKLPKLRPKSQKLLIIHPLRKNKRKRKPKYKRRKKLKQLKLKFKQIKLKLPLPKQIPHRTAQATIL
jgi:hypothetical protein